MHCSRIPDSPLLDRTYITNDLPPLPHLEHLVREKVHTLELENILLLPH